MQCKALIRNRNEWKQKNDVTHILPMSLHLNCILFCRILALQHLNNLPAYEFGVQTKKVRHKFNANKPFFERNFI